MSKKDRLAETYVKNDLEEIEKEIEKEDENPKKYYDEKSDKKENLKIILVVGAIIIIFSAIFVWVYYAKNKPVEYENMRYNGFYFVKYGGLWHTQWQRDNTIYEINLHYNPKEVESIPIFYSDNSSFKITNPTYITFDPGEGKNLGYIALSSAELTLSLKNTFGIDVMPACTNHNHSDCKKMPIVTCETKNATVIYFDEQGEPKAEFKDNCLIISGTREGLLKSTDKVIYSLYKIIR